MKKLLLSELLFVLFFFVNFFFPDTSQAQSPPTCEITAGNVVILWDSKQELNLISLNGNCFEAEKAYRIIYYPINRRREGGGTRTKANAKDTRTLPFEFDASRDNTGENNPGTWIIEVCDGEEASCVSIGDKEDIEILGITQVLVGSPDPDDNLPLLNRTTQPQCSFQVNSPVPLTATNIQSGEPYHWFWEDEDPIEGSETTATSSNLNYTIPPAETSLAQHRTICIDKTGGTQRATGHNCIILNFTTEVPTSTACTLDSVNEIISCPKCPLNWYHRSNGSEIKCCQFFDCRNPDQTDFVQNPTTEVCDTSACTPYKGCNYSPPDPVKPPCLDENIDEKDKCTAVRTGLGFDIGTDPSGFIKGIFGALLSISGMVALFIILKSGYQMMTSQGNPEVIQAAKDSLTSAIVGLLFLIFSMVILQVIGVDILQIPGFG